MRKLLKQFGGWGIKFQNIKRKYQLIAKLEPFEIRYLVIEGFITLGVLLFIYFGCLFLFAKMLYPTDPNSLDPVWRTLGINDNVIHTVRTVFTLLMVVLGIWVTQWRLSRKYRQIELRHVLSELDYIAAGHYDHRISEELAGRLGSVVSSINKLVDSTVTAMAEERAVEQTKNQLITNVSHDIRTPLTSIIGYLSLIEENQYDTIDELKAYTHIAYRKAQQMKRLADNLFDYTKMTSSDMQITYQAINISRFLTQIAVEYETQAIEAGLQIVVDVPSEVVRLLANAELLVRVYDNLLSNAIKYSQGTTITLGAIKQQTQMILTVKNDGVPIEENTLPHVFTRFYRGDTSRNSQVEGSGLGLAIAHSIIERHNGKLTVSSTPQETVFTIVLECFDD